MGAASRNSSSIDAFLWQARALAVLALLILAGAVVSDEIADDFWMRHALLASLVGSVIVVMLSVAVINEVVERRRRRRWSILLQSADFRRWRCLMGGMEQTWFITGSSRGLGRALTQAALDAGDFVAATARQPAQLDDFLTTYGERIHPIGLDVTNPDAARSAITEAQRHFSRLDVVVNNAGYANVSPIETTDDDDFRAQFETNFWGVYHVSKAAIPVLREQGGGLVIQISSVGGRVGGSPGIASYQAAKFAIDGFSRVLRVETAPFGVKVMVVEPSGFRTDWAGSSMTVHEIPGAYAPTVGAMNTRVRQSTDGPAGDPARAAAILVQVAKRGDIPDHLPLGVNAVEGSIRLDEQLLAEDRRWSEVGRSADYGERYPPEFPADMPK